MGPAEFELLTAGKGQKRKRWGKKKKTFANVIFCPLLRYFLQNSAPEGPLASPACPSRKITIAIKISMENWCNDTDRKQQLSYRHWGFLFISCNGFNPCFAKWYITGYLQYFYSLQFNLFIFRFCFLFSDYSCGFNFVLPCIIV